ncbi:MAG TPA: hypothetical protein VJ652_09235 [Noviherbaspirillum sp.]|nr:hypothetical protein [Noviherbaspirillum sp.]
MKSGITVLSLAMAALAVALTGCEKRQAAEDSGPAERAGQQIDQAASRTGEELNKLAGKVGQGLETAGQKLQDEANQARKSDQNQNKQ